MFSNKSNFRIINGINHIPSNFKVDFYTNLTLEFDNNIIANIQSSFYHQDEVKGYGYLYGTKGFIKIPEFWKGNKYQVFIDNKLENHVVNQKSDFKGQIEHAVNCIEKGLNESPYFDLDLHLKFIEIYDYFTL